MYKPFEQDDESFEMHFYILAENAKQWPSMPNTTVIEFSNTQIFRLFSVETNMMDVMLICASIESIPLTYLNKLRKKFRFVINLQGDHSYVSEFQTIVAELCWASYHSHNFDILDVENLLNRNLPILVANSTMIENGWQPKQNVDTAILLLHHFSAESEQSIVSYKQQVNAALNTDAVAAISFGDSRDKNACHYSVLAR